MDMTGLGCQAGSNGAVGAEWVAGKEKRKDIRGESGSSASKDQKERRRRKRGTRRGRSQKAFRNLEVNLRQ